MRIASSLPLARQSVRALAGRPGLTVAAVVTLAVGIAASAALFSLLHAVLLRPLPFPEAERLVMARTTFGGEPNTTSSAPDYFDHRERSGAFSGLGAFLPFTFHLDLTGEEGPQQVTGCKMSWNLLATLGVRPLLGRSFRPEEELGGAATMVSEGFWRRILGGDPGVVGRTLVLDGRPYEIAGVLPAGIGLLGDSDVWLPLERRGDDANVRRFHNWMLVGRLAPDLTLAQAQQRVTAVARQLAEAFPESNRDKGLLLTPLQEGLVRGHRPALLLLFGAVAVLLLIGCGNAAGLLLAGASARRPELAVRAALGASGARLRRQLLGESLCLALLAGSVGLIMARVLQVLLLRLLPMERVGVSHLGLDPVLAGSALGLAVLTAVLAGAVPALHAGRVDPARSLGGAAGLVDQTQRSLVRGTVVVVQVALCAALLVGSGLLVRSLLELVGAELGFSPERLLTAEIRLVEARYPDGARRIAFLRSLVAGVRALPGVTEAGLISRMPIRDPWGNVAVFDPSAPPAHPTEAPLAFVRTVLPGTFRALGIPLHAGRDVADDDTAEAPPVAVVSASLAGRLFEGEPPVGRRVAVDVGEEAPRVVQVVGVVGHVRLNSVEDDSGPALYLSYPQGPGSRMRLVVRAAADPAALVGPLRRLVGRLDADLPLGELETMDEVIAASLARRRAVTGALALFATSALFLAMVGVHALLAFEVGQRRREIGVRRALGARGSGVALLILGRGLGLTGSGLVLGQLVAVAGSRALESQLYGVPPHDPASHLAASLGLLAAAVVTCLVPAWRAARVDPVETLRSG